MRPVKSTAFSAWGKKGLREIAINLLDNDLRLISDYRAMLFCWLCRGDETSKLPMTRKGHGNYFPIIAGES
jgi:hypothetical protein